ncbi:MAG: rhodanese-like domain-containing protein [Chloroflexi bacterium]|nr:rhodanese-like domain-containing protein [Chloroflexota bacterium]
MTVVVDGGSYTSVSPARLTNMLKAKDFVLVNVHIPYEGEIDGTDRFIPYDQVANKLSDLPPAKNARILVYCRSGRMSTIAAKALVALGYTNVWELEGGMIAWEASGYQLVQRPQS